jgi:hypothetical protein
MRRVFGTNYEGQMVHSRLAQGREEMESCGSEEQQNIVLSWRKFQQENDGE